MCVRVCSEEVAAKGLSTGEGESGEVREGPLKQWAVLMDVAEWREPRLGRRGLVSSPCQALLSSLELSQASLVQLMRSR